MFNKEWLVEWEWRSDEDSQRDEAEKKSQTLAEWLPSGPNRFENDFTV